MSGPLIAALILSAQFTVVAAETIDVPVIDGDWWKIGEPNPDLGKWSTDHENAADFTVFQAADGTWQLIGCITGTAWPVGARVFHRWEATNIEDHDWTPKGVFRTPDATMNQLAGMQAPYCFVHDGTWYLYYNAATGFGASTPRGSGAYMMTSPDGKVFTDKWAPDGKPWLFPMGRDIHLLHDDDGSWYAYYNGKVLKPNLDQQKYGVMVARKAATLDGPWSPDAPIGVGGNAESPFVLKRGGRFYLWQQMDVYVSDRPDHFPVDPICDLGHGRGGHYAPEIIRCGDRWYMAAYGRGLYMCRLRWEARDVAQIATWQAEDLPKKRARTKQLVEHAEELKKRAAEQQKQKPATP